MLFLKSSSSIIFNRIKTAIYAVATYLFLTGITDALNESLMYKAILRFFYPDLVEQYVHPLDNQQSFLLWLLPLIGTIIIMLFTSTLTIHHLRKKHVYHLAKHKGVLINQLIMHVENLETALKLINLHPNTFLFHFLVANEKKESFKKLLEKFDKNKYNFYFHIFKESNLAKSGHDLEKILNRIVFKKNKDNKETLAINIEQCSPSFAAAATYCILEYEIILSEIEDDKINNYDLTLIMKN